MTPQEFQSKLNKTAFEQYLEHYQKERFPDDISTWLAKQVISDKEWIHELFEKYEEDLIEAFKSDEFGEYDEEFEVIISRHIEKCIEDGLEDYIDYRMTEYSRDREEERILRNSKYAGNLRPL
jgi:hypothetical protein